MSKKPHREEPPKPEPVIVEPFALSLAQVITMLMAAQSQGATHVQVAIRTLDHRGVSNGIDWVSMAPVDGCVFLGAIGQPAAWDTMTHAELDSLDWTGTTPP